MSDPILGDTDAGGPDTGAQAKAKINEILAAALWANRKLLDDQTPTPVVAVDFAGRKLMGTTTDEISATWSDEGFAMGTKKIAGLGPGSDTADAVNLGQLPLKLADTSTEGAGNITLSGATGTINGVNLAGYPLSILVMEQTDPVENGIYVVTPGSWARLENFDSAADLATGALVVIGSGSSLYGRCYFLSGAGLVPGTSPLEFVPVLSGRTTLARTRDQGGSASPTFSVPAGRMARVPNTLVFEAWGNASGSAEDDSISVGLTNGVGANFYERPSIALNGDWRVRARIEYVSASTADILLEVEWDGGEMREVRSFKDHAIDWTSAAQVTLTYAGAADLTSARLEFFPD